MVLFGMRPLVLAVLALCALPLCPTAQEDPKLNEEQMKQFLLTARILVRQSHLERRYLPLPAHTHRRQDHA